MSPIRVDFYLMGSTAALQDRYVLSCRLLEKAYYRKHHVFVHCQDQAEAELIDELLWTFKPDSFIPHNLQGEGPDNPPPIRIGYQRPALNYSDILINFALEVPEFYTRFRRVIEIVANDERSKEISRAHYRTYRANSGCELFTHEIKTTDIET